MSEVANLIDSMSCLECGQCTIVDQTHQVLASGELVLQKVNKYVNYKLQGLHSIGPIDGNLESSITLTFLELVKIRFDVSRYQRKIH